MKGQCAICYGPILMIDVVGAYLLAAQGIPLGRTFQRRPTITMA